MTSAFGPGAFSPSTLSEQVRRNTEMFEQAMRMFLPFGGGRPRRPAAPPPETAGRRARATSMQLRSQLDEMQKRLDKMADKG